MRWRGTLIGAALGAPIAGPVGSLVGAAAGALLDRGAHVPLVRAVKMRGKPPARSLGKGAGQAVTHRPPPQKPKSLLSALSSALYVSPIEPPAFIPSPTGPKGFLIPNPAWITWHNKYPQLEWAAIAKLAAPAAAAAMKGRPDRSNPSAVNDYCNKVHVMPCFLYPDWAWGYDLGTAIVGAKPDYTTLRAVVNLGQNDSVTWLCHQNGSWSYDHQWGLSFDQAAASVLAFTTSGIFGLVGDVLKPFADALGMGGSVDEVVGFIQGHISESEAQYQRRA